MTCYLRQEVVISTSFQNERHLHVHEQGSTSGITCKGVEIFLNPRHLLDGSVYLDAPTALRLERADSDTQWTGGYVSN
jgi:hypothetical protein